MEGICPGPNNISNSLTFSLLYQNSLLHPPSVWVGCLKRWSRSCHARDVNIRGMEWETGSRSGGGSGWWTAPLGAERRCRENPVQPTSSCQTCVWLSVLCCQTRITRISLSLSKMSGQQKLIEKKWQEVSIKLMVYYCLPVKSSFSRSLLADAQL